MPPVSEQMALPGSRTNPELVAARFLLKPGRIYEEAVNLFQPYKGDKGNKQGSASGGTGLDRRRREYEPRRKTYIYVNNRLEGNALETIRAMTTTNAQRHLRGCAPR